eukprot:COSAG02_NODE_43000_length_379_cov_0.725000_1_plen_56_part_10
MWLYCTVYTIFLRPVLSADLDSSRPACAHLSGIQRTECKVQMERWDLDVKCQKWRQ